MYYQDGKRLTLAAADRKAITEWVGDYLVSGSAPFPLSGAIPAADHKFVIDYNTDVELVDNRDLKDPDEMAKYNHETNAIRNKDVFYRRDDEKHFVVTTDVEISDQFFAWVCGFGKRAKVISPPDIVEKFKDYLLDLVQIY